jgi:hypothetical protein
MNIKIAASFTALLIVSFSTPAAVDAQAAYQSQARPGDFGRASRTTNNFRRADSEETTDQRIGWRLPMTGLGGTAPVFGPTGANTGGGIFGFLQGFTMRNRLPVTSLDSFVLNAGGNAEAIYGDEGADGLPPYFEFTTAHRINTGITGARDAGLTTGHGSYLPDAWGGDEFVDGPEWSQSGANGGFPANWSQGTFTGFPVGPRTSPPGGNPAFNNQVPRSLNVNNRRNADPGMPGGTSLNNPGSRDNFGGFRPGNFNFSVPTFGPGGINIGGLFGN